MQFDQLADELKVTIGGRICLLAQGFNDQIARAANLAGLTSDRNVDGIKRIALQHLAMSIELLAREKRVKVAGVLLPNRTEKRVEHWVKAENLRTTADLESPLRLLFDFPERTFFVYEQEDQRSEPLAEAVDRGDILIEKTELYYFVEGPGLFRRIDPNTKSPAEKVVLASRPKYVRHKLTLGTRKRRELENLEVIRMQREADLNPLELKPNFFGFGIDLAKVPAWLRRVWRRWHPGGQARL